MSFVASVFGNSSERKVRKMQPTVDEILDMEDEFKKLSDEELRAKTTEFKERIAKGESLDSILPEAFATVREASARTLGMKHYPVQLTGGIALHNGNIAELATGEGKSNPVTTPIPTPNGWRTVGEIEVGDSLFDRYGNLTKVVAIYPQGKIDTYRVTFKDGRTIDCGEEHLWNVYYYKTTDKYLKNVEYTLTTKQLLEVGLTNEKGYNFSVPLNFAVDYKEKDLIVDPYMFGMYIANGFKGDDTRITFNGVKQGTELYDVLHNLRPVDRYIPDMYKLGSIEQRWSLIQGMMDASGQVIVKPLKEDANRYFVNFNTVSKRLRDDFKEVIYSLGYSCWSSVSTKTKKNGSQYYLYTVKINADNMDKYRFFSMSADKHTACKAYYEPIIKDYTKVDIIKIDKLPEQTEQVCFVVDNPEHLFLIGEYIVTHNTLVATCPAYLNALTGDPVYIVTVNDYLAKRDSEWMGRVYEFLGLSVGLITQDNKENRKEQYKCDIVYGTNSEIGFDYLRDNMVYHEEEKVQRGFGFAIVDEVDSILIDESRTPLIISGFNGETDEGYRKADEFVRTLHGKVVVEKDNGTALEQAKDRVLGNDAIDLYADYDYVVEEKRKTATLTAKGIEKAEIFYDIENLGDMENASINHFITRALRAHGVFQKDIDYVVKDGKVMIVDESTGRIMDGRRYSDGIHQAIEAKEQVHIQEETKTLATITYQNFFRKFKKLAGMTGTASTEKEEFLNIYNLDVISVPTNKPVIRIDHNDVMYAKYSAKMKAIVDQVKECHAKGQPVLIGTVSVAKSEALHEMLEKEGLPHTVLNAKYHEKEAKIVAQAGRYGAITVATNMAGRGTDIILGGNPEFAALKELTKEGYSDELIAEAREYSKTDDEEILNIRKLYREKVDRLTKEFDVEKQQVLQAGGLFILGTERHESRRIDNQLRGRSGRQGDPGESLFILSFEDDLLRIFGEHKMVDIFESMNLPTDVPVNLALVGKSVEKAQKAIESNFYQMRRKTLEFDEVIAKQRDIIYSERDEIVCNRINPVDSVRKMMLDGIDKKILHSVDGRKHIQEEDYEIIKENLDFLDRVIEYPEYDHIFETKELQDILKKQVSEHFDEMIASRDGEYMKDFCRKMLLFLIDNGWQEQLVALDELKEGINLRALGQKDPLQEFQSESFDLFESMVNYMRDDLLNTMMSLYYSTIIEPKLEKETA